MRKPNRPVQQPLYTRRWFRISALVLLLVGVLVVGLVQAFPHLLEWYVRARLNDAAERLDRRITFDSLELERLNLYHFTNLVISEDGPRQDRPFFTAERLTVGFHRARLFTGSLVLREILATEPHLYLRDYPDGSSNYREVLQPVLVELGLAEAPDRQQPDEGSQGAEPSEARQERDRSTELLRNLIRAGMPKLVITRGRIDLSEASLEGAPGQIGELEARIDPTGRGYACSFQLDAQIDQIQVESLAHPIRQIHLQGQVDPQDDVAMVRVGIGEPLEFREVPGFPDIRLRVGQIGFEYPYSFYLENLEVIDRRTHYTVVEVPELIVTLSELTVDPHDLYLSLVKARGVRVYADIDRQGRTNIARLLGVPGAGPLGYLLPPDRREEDAPSEEVEAPPAPSSPTDAIAQDDPGVFAALEQELARRRWWEIMPQTTDLTDVSFEILVHDGATPIRTLDLEIPRILAAKRLYNFQMDVSAEAQLSERGVGGVGSIAAEFVYYYIPEHWSLELNFNQVDLQRFIDVMPFPNVLGIIDGQLDGVLTVADSRPEESFSLEGNLRLADFGFLAPTFDSAVIDQLDLSYDFALTYDNRQRVSMERGHLTLGGVQAEVLVGIEQLEPVAVMDYLVGFALEHDDAYWQRRSAMPPPWERFGLVVDMPRQPVMTVFHAIPMAMRRRVAQTEMTGEVGWRLDAEARYERLSDGRLDVDVPVPRVADVLDEGVMLVSMPEEVDVRRLLTDFTFTFVDGIGQMRLITIGKNNPHWATLDEISPIMVQSILNTEDQGFFENDGFNWRQMRNVIAQLLAEQEFGRGASTITMQTAKNIFLSRERQLSRKFTEMFLAYWMTLIVPKARILELYLNVIEFGPGINGVSEAASYYFGERPLDLTLGEATFLVSIVPNPRLYHYFYEQGEISDRWWQHMQRYMRRLLERDVITQEQFDRATRRRPQFYIRTEGSPALRPEPLPEDLVLPFLEQDD